MGFELNCSGFEAAKERYFFNFHVNHIYFEQSKVPILLVLFNFNLQNFQITRFLGHPVF